MKILFEMDELTGCCLTQCPLRKDVKIGSATCCCCKFNEKVKSDIFVMCNYVYGLPEDMFRI